MHSEARRLVDALPTGIIVADAAGRLLELNDAARELLGIADTPQTVAEVGAAVELREFGSEALVTEQASLFTRAARGESAHGRFTFTDHRTSQRRVVEASTRPARDGERIVATVMALHDVTAAVDAERRREEFLSIVSHELKTPLTPLKALAQLIRTRLRRAREAGREPDLDSLEKNLVAIERQVDRMTNLVNDLLDISRASRGTFQIDPQPFDLAPAVRDLVQRYVDATAEDGRHHYRTEIPDSLPLTADQSRVEQVLWNLVGNAVKYSPRGGEVRVRLRAAEGLAVIEVSDQGIGIAAGDLDRLGRTPFARGAGKAETFSGMGIGLYLSRLVAEGHGGTLELESAGVDRGTTVRVCLPREW